MPHKLRNNQSGFSLVEGLLIVIAVALVAFVGYYVWHSQHQANATLNAASKDASSSPSKVTKKTVPSSFKVPALGIELVNVPTTLSNLTYYEFAPSDPMIVVNFSSSSLTTADSACSAKNGSGIGGLTRYTGTYNSGASLADDTTFVKQFSDFWVAYTHPQGACSKDSDAEALHQTQISTFKSLVTTPADLQAIQ